MELIAAIDILGGRVVRLRQGRYDEVTVFNDDPARQAALFYERGARRLHVVDLDGARSGEPRNVQVVKSILAAAPVRLELGGGIRNRETAERWFEAGVERVVLGTSAIKNPQMAEQLCAEHPAGVVVAVDSRGGEVAVEGWQEGSGSTDMELALRAERWGAAAILYTVIDRDGTSEGPNVEATLALQQRVGITVIASGGIGTLEHIRRLAKSGIRAAVCGRALYSGAFTLREAFAAAQVS